MPETILTETPGANVTPSIPDNVLEALVGDGKTYKTVEDLAKGKLNADVHIQRLELENKEFREKLAGAKTVEDLLEQVKASSAPVTTTTGTETTTTPQVGMSAEEIAKLVDKTMQGREMARVKSSNKARAEAKLKEAFGEKATEVFNKEASTPELRQALIQLAEVDPDKFAGLFIKQTTPSGLDSGDNSRNTLNLNLDSNQSVVPGTQAYYNEMRKKTPKVYYSAATQLEMHRAALADPNKYFGRKA